MTSRSALHHRSIIQPREPAFWIFVAFLAYGTFRMTAALGQLASISRSGWVSTPERATRTFVA